MKRPLSFSILALLAATAAASSAPTQVPQESPYASILFARANIDPLTGYALQSSLFRINPAGGTVVPLTPAIANPEYDEGRWSPSGSSIVYAHYGPAYPQLSIVDRQGGSKRRITWGDYPHKQPAWGPLGSIAFVIDRDTGQGNPYEEGCLSVVAASGGAQHGLFCPPFRSDLRTVLYTSTPQWSADGKSIYIVVSALQAGLDPTFLDERIYRVNATTGAAAKLTEQKLDNHVSIAPDGNHAVFAGAPITLIDLRTGARKTLAATGDDVRYSKDGCRIAFVQRNSPINTQFFGTVFVMNANGSDVRRAIARPDPSARYAIADWSPDGSRLLVNKAVNNQVNDQVLQIVNLTTHTATTLARGSASEGAWYEP
jgi:Tol biopolymer transport system component